MPKKGNVSNEDFLQQVVKNAKVAAKEVSEDLSKTLTDEKKGIEVDNLQYVDILLMDDAPPEWNDYPRLVHDQQDKYLELKMSIYENGVQQPLVVWQRNGGRYMVLAGHNRKDICLEILDECKDEKGFDEKKYRFLPCNVKKADEIDENMAQDIIDDTNCQRDFSKLPNKVKIAVTKRRMNVYKRRRYAKGERIDQLAKDLGIEKSAVYENLAINEKIIEPFQELYYSGVLTRKAVLKFTYFDKPTQEWMNEEFGSRITEAKIKSLKKNMDRDDIRHVFDEDTVGIKKLTIEVPENLVEEFREMFDEWKKMKVNN